MGKHDPLWHSCGSPRVHEERHVFLHYQGDVDPDLDQSAGKQLKFDLAVGAKIGTVVADAQAVDGQAWRINIQRRSGGVDRRSRERRVGFCQTFAYGKLIGTALLA